MIGEHLPEELEEAVDRQVIGEAVAGEDGGEATDGLSPTHGLYKKVVMDGAGEDLLDALDALIAQGCHSLLPRGETSFCSWEV